MKHRERWTAAAVLSLITATAVMQGIEFGTLRGRGCEAAVLVLIGIAVFGVFRAEKKCSPKAQRRYAESKRQNKHNCSIARNGREVKKEEGEHGEKKVCRVRKGMEHGKDGQSEALYLSALCGKGEA